MGKMKTNKSVKGRFKMTKKGKLKRNRPLKSHLLTKKSSKRKRHLKKQRLVSESHRKTYLRMMAK